MSCIFECVLCCKTTLSLICLFVGWKLYMRFTTGVCKSSKRLDGKTVIVTGSNTGIGKEAALDFAQRRAKVILACRNTDKAQQARDDIILQTGNKDVVVQKLDLTSLASVRAFSKVIHETEDKIDILVNNAGIGGGRKKTEDGLIVGMQVNHFAPFLLTNLLLDLVKKSESGRIIFVSSVLHKFANFSVDNLNWEKGGPSYQVYNYSKLANLLNANELARQLRGTNVTVNSLHPGAVNTDIWRNLPSIVQTIIRVLGSQLFKSAKEGAQTTIYLAVSEEVEGISGKYFVDCKMTDTSPEAVDEKLAKAVWEKSEAFVNPKK